MADNFDVHARERLARIVVARRRDLHLTQEDVNDRGGPSTATLRQIEQGREVDYRRGTILPLEQILGWTPGSIQTVLRGGQPTVADELVRPDDQDAQLLASLPPEALEGLGAAERAEVVAAMKLSALEKAREVRRRLDQ